MSDAISRQQAIDDIWTVSPLARLDRKWIDRWLRQLPPIQPEPHWIPVTERLPETGGRYIVVNSKIGAWHVDIDFYRPYMGGWMYDQGVVAWMPLPEYYKG